MLTFSIQTRHVCYYEKRELVVFDIRGEVFNVHQLSRWIGDRVRSAGAIRTQHFVRRGTTIYRRRGSR